MQNTVLHEMAHIIGIGTLWGINGAVAANLTYIGESATHVWVNDWGCKSSAPPVETDYGPGTAGGHWDEQWYDNSLPVLSNELNPRSNISAQILALALKMN